MKDLGEAKQFLGIQIEYNRQEGTMKLHQSNTIQAILKRYGIERANPVYTLMLSNSPLVPDDQNQLKGDEIT